MRFVLLALAFCALASPAAADRFSLSYEGLGLRVAHLGTIQVDADVSEDSYQVSARLRSGGLLNLFERTNLTARAAGEISPSGAVLWRRYDLDHHYSEKHRTIALRMDETGALSRAIEPNYRLWGDPPASQAQIRRSRDPLSTLIAMAIDVGRSRRCAGAYPTFDGRFHYLLELAGGRVTEFSGGGYEGDVLRCSLSYVAVSGFEARDAGRRRIPHGQVWFALEPDSTFAPPVRITTPLAAGAATIRLTEYRRARVDVQITEAAP